MLPDQRSWDYRLRKPCHRVEEKKTGEREDTLAQAYLEWPGRSSYGPDVVGKMSEGRVIVIDRVAPNIFVEKQLWSEEKRAKNDCPDH